MTLAMTAAINPAEILCVNSCWWPPCSDRLATNTPAPRMAPTKFTTKELLKRHTASPLGVTISIGRPRRNSTTRAIRLTCAVGTRISYRRQTTQTSSSVRSATDLAQLVGGPVPDSCCRMALPSQIKGTPCLTWVKLHGPLPSILIAGASAATARSLRPCWRPSQFHGWGRADPAPGQT